MSRFPSLVALCVFLPAVALSVEWIETPFMDGLYTVTVPEGWLAAPSADETRLVVTEPGDDTSFTHLYAPNPSIDADRLEEYAEAFVADLYRRNGEGEIIHRSDNPFQGYPAKALIFTIDNDGTVFAGLSAAINFDGNVMAVTVFGEAEKFDRFVAWAGKLLDSYKLDSAKAAAIQEKLAALGAKIVADHPIQSGGVQ